METASAETAPVETAPTETASAGTMPTDPAAMETAIRTANAQQPATGVEPTTAVRRAPRATAPPAIPPVVARTHAPESAAAPEPRVAATGRADTNEPSDPPDAAGPARVTPAGAARALALETSPPVLAASNRDAPGGSRASTRERADAASESPDDLPRGSGTADASDRPPLAELPTPFAIGPMTPHRRQALEAQHDRDVAARADSLEFRTGGRCSDPDRMDAAVEEDHPTTTRFESRCRRRDPDF